MSIDRIPSLKSLCDCYLVENADNKDVVLQMCKDMSPDGSVFRWVDAFYNCFEECRVPSLKNLCAKNIQINNDENEVLETLEDISQEIFNYMEGFYEYSKKGENFPSSKDKMLNALDKIEDKNLFLNIVKCFIYKKTLGGNNLNKDDIYVINCIFALAIKKDYLEVCEFLLANGFINIDVKINLITDLGIKKNYMSSLELIIDLERKEILNLLLKYKPDLLHYSDKSKNQLPLVIACCLGKYSIVELLIKKAINFTGEFIDQDLFILALECSIQNGHLDILKLLLSHKKMNQSLNDLVSDAVKLAIDSLSVDMYKFIKNDCRCYFDSSKNGSVAMYAAYIGAFEILEFLYEDGENFNEIKARSNDTLLTRTAANGDQEGKCIEFLIGLDLIDIHYNKLENNKAAIHCAAETGFANSLQILLNHGANIDQEDAEGNTPLILAASSYDDRLAKIKVLLEGGADIRHTNSEGSTAVAIIINTFLNDNIEEFDDHLEIIDILLKYLEDDEKNELLINNITNFIDKSEEDDDDYYDDENIEVNKKLYLELIEILLKNDADPNFPIVDVDVTFPPLCYAFENGINTELVKLLLRYNADPNLQSNDNVTSPICLAIGNDDLEVIELLLKCRANPNLRDYQGSTPLMYAVKKNKFDSIKLLLKYGADPNSQDKRGYTPLMYAVKKNKFDSIKLLLKSEYKANISIPNNEGKTALDLAKEKDFQDIYNMLEKTHDDLINTEIANWFA